MLATLVLLAATATPDSTYAAIESRYVREFLRRHPVVSTYLGGSGLDPSLAEADGALRDWSPKALEFEARFYRDIQTQLGSLDAETLSPAHRIDRDVILHQIDFMLRETEKRRHWQRSVDTYVNEPFRGLDWYLQGMKELGNGQYGTEDEWRRVAARVGAIPAYLKAAQANLAAGKAAGNLPDFRLVDRDGIKASEENARYLEKELLETAAVRTKGQPFAGKLTADLAPRAKAAAVAFRAMGAFLKDAFAVLPAQDRFAMGAVDYDWALQNNLGIPSTAARLYEQSLPPIEATRIEIMRTAARIADRLGLELQWGTSAEREASVRAVMSRLEQDYPKSDAELREGYEAVGRRLVEYGRRSGMFDIPADYRLEVTITPPVLENSVDSASYYPAPIFRGAGVGRFYVPVTHGDPELLKQQNRHAMAYLAAHEGFPGHDWHYKVMTEHRAQIGPVRWLTPGEVEGSGSMWQDSVASEGWGLYAEQLMAEPAKGAPDGFYTPEERLYQLRGQLWRDLRVRLDTGLHTGRIGYDEAVDYLSSTYDLLPGSCHDADLSPDKKASCKTCERAVYRYSKWPTQAVSYRLGKQQILALRAKADALQPPADRKRFHLLYMQQGTIPPAYFEDALLDELRKK
jgi:uncharacterized protein (DUF885 family)